MDSKIWGSSLWKAMFAIAVDYENNLHSDKANSYYQFFKCLGYVLPCEFCRVSYQRFFTELDFKYYLNKPNGMVKLVYDLKEKVNQKLIYDETENLKRQFIELCQKYQGDLENERFWTELRDVGQHICYTKSSPSFQEVLDEYKEQQVQICDINSKTCRK